jgi:hypothetical protein
MTGRAPLPDARKAPKQPPKWRLLERQGSEHLLVQCPAGHRYFVARRELRFGDGGDCPHCPVEPERTASQRRPEYAR